MNLSRTEYMVLFSSTFWYMQDSNEHDSDMIIYIYMYDYFIIYYDTLINV